MSGCQIEVMAFIHETKRHARGINFPEIAIGTFLLADGIFLALLMRI
ncbi:hypothetical protein BH09ACT10_BH09ACT10_26030 [soil metagenome]